MNRRRRDRRGRKRERKKMGRRGGSRVLACLNGRVQGREGPFVSFETAEKEGGIPPPLPSQSVI